VDMINAMLLNAKLPNNLWGEALLTACHMHNRVLSKKSNVSPYEVWNGRKPRITSIRVLFALTSIYKLYVHQMDGKMTFLNGDLKEEVYMKQPEGFILPGNEEKVCKFVKSLYGLKQAPKQWHEKFDKAIC